MYLTQIDIFIYLKNHLVNYHCCISLDYIFPKQRPVQCVSWGQPSDEARTASLSTSEPLCLTTISLHTLILRSKDIHYIALILEPCVVCNGSIGICISYMAILWIKWRVSVWYHHQWDECILYTEIQTSLSCKVFHLFIINIKLKEKMAGVIALILAKEKGR